MTVLSDRLPEILEELNLKIYGAAQLIAAETDEDLIAIQMKLGRWHRDRTTGTWRAAEKYLDILGYKITIEKK